jgi:hypothetical protein
MSALSASPPGLRTAIPWSSDAWLETAASTNVVIMVLDLRIHQLSVLPSSQGLFSARWSPNGRYIADLSSDSQAIMRFRFQDPRVV